MRRGVQLGANVILSFLAYDIKHPCDLALQGEQLCVGLSGGWVFHALVYCEQFTRVFKKQGVEGKFGST
jgi:hypothetical protein